MRTLSRWLSRFSYNHPNFSVDGLIRYIVAGNLLVFMLDLFTHGVSTAFLTFVPAYILRGQVWRLITFIFVPMSFSPLSFILMTVFTYFMGTRLENALGSARFTVYYGLGVGLNIIVGLLLPLINPMYQMAQTADMHYLHLAMFFAYATLYPDMTVLAAFFIPIRLKWLALLDVALLRAAAAKAGVSDITQKRDVLRFQLAVFRPESVVRVCGLNKYRQRLTVAAGEDPALTLKLKPGADALESAMELVEDLKLSAKE